jgi:2-oxo-4-hydroxy-4-carboxy-5-ureidoimidazoline decarboxylase
MKTASEVSALSVEEFVAAVGGVYEKSPWIAERAHAAGPYESLVALRDGLRKVVDEADTEAHLALLRAHPDLAGKAALAGELTVESTEEQARAGLGSLTPEEMARFEALNGQYKAKFGFPFVLAVRNASKGVILASFARRVSNTASAELAEGLSQVHKIAWMRLRGLVTPNPTGFLTCHVLDTARGLPAGPGMAISLRFLNETSGEWETVGQFVTNADGRLEGGPALKGAAFRHGTYEWTFGVGDYFASVGVPTHGTMFLSDVPLRFGIDDAEAHYHVPLLCSPWSYSTYRGS